MSGSARRSGAARVGCSGWMYRDWRGPVYPEGVPQRAWFRHYAQRFDTVELNNTFYRLPQPAAVEGWREQAPPGFCYALKVGQFGTHRKKLRDADQWLPRHLERVELLEGALGPNLVQLPPNWRRDAPRLDAFLDVAPRHVRWAVELRDESWLHDEVFDVLARHGAALCVHDLIPGHPWERTTDWAYLRFHGPDAVRRPYHGRYGQQRLRSVADRLDGWLADGCDVYAYFNNDVAAAAVTDAEWLRNRLAGLPG